MAVIVPKIMLRVLSVDRARRVKGESKRASFSTTSRYLSNDSRSVRKARKTLKLTLTSVKHSSGVVLRMSPWLRVLNGLQVFRLAVYFLPNPEVILVLQKSELSNNCEIFPQIS